MFQQLRRQKWHLQVLPYKVKVKLTPKELRQKPMPK